MKISRQASLLLLVCIVAACADSVETASSGAETLRSFKAAITEIEQAAADDKQGLGDALVQSREWPLVVDSTVIFLFQGVAGSVSVAGDANGWSPSASPLEQIDSTDVWIREENFEPTARLDYKIVVDGEDWILDPQNPAKSVGGFGANSELAMGHYVQPAEILENPEIPHGAISRYTIRSEVFQQDRRYTVYVPVQSSSERAPLVLFTDGSDFINLGKAANVLDHLIAAGEIPPVFAVFEDPLNRDEEYAGESYARYEAYLVDELLPVIKANYPVTDDPAQTAIVGTSYGGYVATKVCFNQPEIFGRCGIFSPSYWVEDGALIEKAKSRPPSDSRFYLDWGTYEPQIAASAHRMKDVFASHGYTFEWAEWPEAHSWGSWRAHLDLMLIWLFQDA